MKAKKAVFTEKPVATKTEDVVSIFELEEELNGLLFCGFNRRFDPTIQAMHKSIYEGKVGHIWQIKHVQRDSPLSPIEYLKNCGNIFIDCMIHEIDLMVHFLGEFPKEVFTLTQNNIPELEAVCQYDGALVTFKYPSGKLIFNHLSILQN